MENKPKCTIDKIGTKRWYNENGDCHREDGPAIELLNGTKCWYKHGYTHRLDGPAIIYHDGKVGWWVNGKNITEHMTHWAKDNDIDLDNLSEDDKLLIKLVWG